MLSVTLEALVHTLTHTHTATHTVARPGHVNIHMGYKCASVKSIFAIKKVHIK